MEWESHFEEVFFEAWLNAGLPHHKDFVNEYVSLREHGEYPSAWIKQSPAISSGITGSQLYSVYGFGVATGMIFAEMLGLDKSISENTSDWCGRFNLGISLYDYICDELGGVNSVAALKVFEPFIENDFERISSTTPAEKLLSSLSESVILDLKNTVKDDKISSLLTLLQQMFEAENFVSKAKFSSASDFTKIENALSLKSAEPFRAMAEYTGYNVLGKNPLLINNIGIIGKAIGNCYWLIDDARDVWNDLKAEQWNLFLLEAAKNDPLIFTKDSKGIEKELMEIWYKTNLAQNVSAQIIEDLKKAIKKLGLSSKTEHHTLGLVSASLWQWYKY